MTSSTPITNSRPPITASGIWPTTGANRTTSSTTVPAATKPAIRLDDPEQVVREFTRELVLGVRDNAEQIDKRIGAAAPRQWPIERMPRIDRNLARIAIYELDHTEVEASAAISEALELADELSTDESVAFLNGLLGRAAQSRLTQSRPERTTDEQ